MNIRNTLRSLGYVGASELKKMRDAEKLLVHTAVLCERLRGVDCSRETGNRRKVVMRLERVLYGGGDQRMDSMMCWSQRVSMTAGEVRIFFGRTDNLPIRAIKRKTADKGKKQA